MSADRDTPVVGLEQVDPAVFNPVKVPTPEALADVLHALNENGEPPVLVGFDREGQRFLAYGYEVGGDEMHCAVITDDPRGATFDYFDVGRCEHCAAFERRDLAILNYPVVVL